MLQTTRWELLGLLLTLGAAAFGLIYAAPGLASLTLAARASVTFSITAGAALGLAGLVLTVLGSLSAIVVSQLKVPGSDFGAALIIWTNFIAVVLGDILFYAGYTGGTDMLVGLVSAALTVTGHMVISGRGRAVTQPG